MNKFMTIALNEAKKAYIKREVPVGAVIVKDDVIISKAHNLREHKNTSLAHAEILAIEKACKKLNSWRLDDCTMYVTLEPCMMCAGAITQSRIQKVVIGAMDEKNGVVESIAKVFDIKTTTKVEYEIQKEEECSNILSNFFKELRNNKK
ncbi:MAG: nucleoside deaminase [Clostridia bacterium]|nr:nucleoside deaminase [Clostridia bacterium]MDD4387176.1 nucleoside deaminase [Clostridia bacterium]